MEAATLTCSACGGKLPEGAGTCPFCSAIVAARRCLSCFHDNLASAQHCAACGRELGLEPIAERDDLTCPSCKTAFVSIATGGGTLHECPKCLGQFLDHATFRALCEERLQLEASQRSSTVPASASAAPVRYLPCPVCAKSMNRKNFGERSGVIVDVCKSHGIWFDRGELPRVLAFVEAGGLREAERRAQERKHDERLRAAAAAAHIEVAQPQEFRHTTESIDLLGALLRHLIS